MIRIIQTLAQTPRGWSLSRHRLVTAPAVLSMPLIKVYFSIRWLTGRGYVERGPNDVDSVFPLFADVPSYRLTRRGWGVALFHLAKNHKQRFRDNVPGARKFNPISFAAEYPIEKGAEHPIMAAARMEYAADLFGMTDQEIEREIRDAEETINDAESWLEALIAEREYRK